MLADVKTAIVTGAGQGLGRALAIALAEQGVRVLVSDQFEHHAHDVAQQIKGVAHVGDMADPVAISDMIDTATSAFGVPDLLISNAGFATGEPDGATSQPDAQWQRSWDVHVMAHLRASRLLAPDMRVRGRGILVNVASAAGLLCQIGDAAYSATKHAAVSLAQSLALEHGDDGIQVSVVAPLYIATPLLGYSESGAAPDRPARTLTAPEAADAILQGIAAQRFLILPHDEAKLHFQHRANDTDRWIKGMRRLRSRIMDQADGTSAADLHRLISD